MKRVLILSFIALVLVAGVAAVVFFVNGPGGDPISGEERGQGLFGSLFPFGTGGSGGRTPASTDGALGASADTRPIPALRKVTETPASGAYYYTDATGGVVIRFIERASGHVYDTPAEGRSVMRISNTTIPGIQEVLFASKDAFIIRSLDENDAWENFYATLADGEVEQALTGSFLSDWERGVLDARGENLLSVRETANGSSVVLSGPDGSGGRVLLSSPIASWVPLQSDSDVYVYTAPTSGIPGFLYRVAGGELRRVLGEIPGMLAVVSESGRYVLVSGGEEAGTLSLFDTETGEWFESPIDTFANKCVFISEPPPKVVCGIPDESLDGNYPDDWLRGAASLNDDIWLIEPTLGVATLLTIPEDDAGAAVDVWRPFVGPENSYFGFINKKDLSLWSLRLREPVVEEGGE